MESRRSTGRGVGLCAALIALAVVTGSISAASAAGRADNADPGAAALPAGRVHVSGVAAQVLVGFSPVERPYAPNKEQIGYVDWTDRKAVAVGRAPQRGAGGQSRLRARAAARTAALRNILAMAAGIRIGPNGRVGQLRNGRVILQGMIRNWGDTRYRSEVVRGVTWWIAEIDIPMFGRNGVAVKFYDTQLAIHRQRIEKRKRAPWAKPSAVPDRLGDVLVFDCRGSGFAPEMYPTIIDADGRVIFDMQTVTKDVAVSVGPCAYATSKVAFEKLATAEPAQPGEDAFAALRLAAGPVGLTASGGASWRPLLAPLAAGAPGATSAPASRPTTQAATQPRRRPRRYAVRATRGKGDKAVLVVADKKALAVLKDPRAAGLARNGRVVILVDAAGAGMDGYHRLPWDRTRLASR